MSGLIKMKVKTIRQHFDVPMAKEEVMPQVQEEYKDMVDELYQDRTREHEDHCRNQVKEERRRSLKRRRRRRRRALSFLVIKLSEILTRKMFWFSLFKMAS